MARPAFIREYKLDGGSLFLHSGNPVSAIVAHNFVESLVLGEASDVNGIEAINNARNAPFWILEGLIIEHELDAEKHPSLAYYLNNRTGTLQERWDFYKRFFDTNESLEVVLAYNKTRRHAMETEVDLPNDEKKSD